MVNRKVGFSTEQALERLKNMSLSELQAHNKPQSEGYKARLKLYGNLLYGGRTAYVEIMADQLKMQFLNSEEPLSLVIQGYEDPTSGAKLYRDRQTNRMRRKLFVYHGGPRQHHHDGVDYPIEVKAYTFIADGTSNRRIRGADGDAYENVEIKEFELKWLWEIPLKRALKEDYGSKFLDGAHAREVLGTNYGFRQQFGLTAQPGTEADLDRLSTHLLDYFVEVFGESEVWAPSKPGQKAHKVPLLLYAGTIKSIPEGRGAKVKKRNAMRASLLYMQQQEDARFRSYSRNADEESGHLPLKAADTHRGRSWDDDPYAGLDDDPGDYGDYGFSDLDHEAYLEADGFYQATPDTGATLSRLRQLVDGADADDSAQEHPPEWVEGYVPTAQQQRRQQQQFADLEAQATALLAAATIGNGKGKGKGKVAEEPVLTGTRLFTNPADAL